MRSSCKVSIFYPQFEHCIEHHTNHLSNFFMHFHNSGFGQKEGRVGFRTTFLPQEEELEKAIGEFKRHHELFCEKYA